VQGSAEMLVVRIHVGSVVDEQLCHLMMVVGDSQH
jgi:hypothetical protein